MKKIGLLGGMSWESTASYYRLINEGVKERLGGLHSARIVLYSVDFAPLEKLQAEGDWKGAAIILADAARKIEGAGADFLLICTNTMHKVAPQVEEAVTIPLLHIADATAGILQEKNFSTVGLLGTSFTMEQDFYRGRLQDKFSLKVLIPGEADRHTVHRVIYEELCLGRVRDGSKKEFLRIIQSLADQGAEAVILGCTEIGMLVDEGDTGIPLIDTTLIHAGKAVEYACTS